MRCEECGRDFKPRRDWARFCCKQCQQAWNRRRYRMAEVMAAEHRLNGNGQGRLNISRNIRNAEEALAELTRTFEAAATANETKAARFPRRA